MTSSQRIASVLALASVVADTALSAPVPDTGLAELQLRAADQRFIDAFVANDVGDLDLLIDPDFRFTSHDGEWLSRAEFLARKPPAQSRGRAAHDSVRVRVFGDVAVLHAVVSVATDDAAPLRLRSTDVYAWNGAQWRMLSAQHTALRQGVPAQSQAASVPVHATWQGQDPTGRELDVLRELNEQYVQAFRAADVAWYDAHLAPDYIAIYGDGSMHERASALADFAQPYFAEHLKSFPVGHVRIRRHGALALVSAENAYERKDGRRGVNRYTDLWLERDGRWLCVAAHITVHAAAS